MLRLDKIVGKMSEEQVARTIHALDHVGRVERIWLSAEDTRRHRLHITTDRGRECAIRLPRAAHLSDGDVLLLSAELAIVICLTPEKWLILAPRDAAAALELGYLSGNMHWSVRFDGPRLHIALRADERDYIERLTPLLADNRIRRVEADG